MVKIHTENIKSNFEGTIIDLETIGGFNSGYNDSRVYKDITPVVFGLINKENIKIFCAKTEKSIVKLKEEMELTLSKLERPFYAFNSDFERGVLFHFLDKKILFEKELNLEKFESKKFAIQSLKIPNYQDPFYDNGRACMEAWLKGAIDKSILHNRACLLKERDILLKRGFRNPDKLQFIK